jgi:membrane protease YdiL (CAAX protease family)
MTSDAIPMPYVRPRWKRLLLDSAIARIVIFILLFAVFVTATGNTFKHLLGWFSLPPNAPLRLVADVLVRIVPSVLAYWIVVRFIEKRRMEELAPRDLLAHNILGITGGAVLIGSVIAALWIAGGYAVSGISADVAWLRPLLIFGFATAIVEEIIFRGILFRIVDDAWGLWPALIVSALFFGGVHIGNQNATWWTSFAIAVEAGVLLGVVYHVTKSLWACIGMHMSWNFLQGTVFGSPVSGMAPKSSWLVPQFSGPDWLTGGSFGIEGSVLTVLLSLVFSGVLLAAARRRQAQNAVMA